MVCKNSVCDLGGLYWQKSNIIFITRILLVSKNLGQILLCGFHNVALPSFYSSPDRTKQTLAPDSGSRSFLKPQ